MNSLNEVKKLLKKVLADNKDVLFVVPPFTTNAPNLANHILSETIKEAGFTSDILYLNLLLASVIGFELSEKLGSSEIFQYWGMLNERLFARAAYKLPPLGKNPEHCNDEAMSVTGSKFEHKKMDFDISDTNSREFLEIETICFHFIRLVADEIANYPYKVIAFTSRMGQNNASVALINRLKKNRPGFITVIGGSNCQNEMAQGIASLSKKIDYVFSGESEQSFLNFLSQVKSNHLPDTRIIYGKPKADLNNIPTMDYSSYFYQINEFLPDHINSVKYIWSETSRGCWWGEKKKCTFCSRNDETLSFRYKKVDKIIEELEHYHRNYPGKSIAMTDNIMPFSYYKSLLPILAQKQNYPEITLYYTKANIKFHQLLLLKQAGVKQLIPGMETLSTPLLKLMNKGVTARENVLLLRNATSLGIKIFWFMLWGIPGDKKEYYQEILNLLPLIEHLQPPSKFFSVHIERFSKYFQNPEQFNIKNIRPWAVYKDIYPDYADIDKLAFNFIGDFQSEAYEYPDIIQKIASFIKSWNKNWQKNQLTLKPFGNYYLIHDARSMHSKIQRNIIDKDKAFDIMTYGPYLDNKSQRWAIEKKIAVSMDSKFVPLVTCDPETIILFENIKSQKKEEREDDARNITSKSSI